MGASAHQPRTAAPLAHSTRPLVRLRAQLGLQPRWQANFGDWLEARGFERYRAESTGSFRGIRLKPNLEPTW